MPFWSRNKRGDNVSSAQPQAAVSPAKTKSVGDVLWEAKLPRYAHMAKFAEEHQDYPEADATYQLLVESLRRTRGPEHPDVATAVYQWARLNAHHDFEPSPEMQIVRNSMGPAGMAGTLHREALMIREKARGQSHRDFAESLYGVATCSQPGEAVKLLHQALKIQEATLSDDSYEVALSLNELGRIHYATGDARTALQLFGRALQVHRKAAAKQRLIDEAAQLCGTADACLKSGAGDEAVKALNKALRIQQIHMSDAYFEMTYRICGDSLAILPMILDLHRMIFRREGRVALAATLNGLADVHKSLGDAGAALPYLEEAVEVHRRLNEQT